MHCPSCGTATSVDQKFCRLCGLSLERFAQLLAQELPSSLDAVTTGATDKDLRPSRMAKVGLWGITVLAVGGAALVALIAYEIIARIIIEKGELFVGLAFLLVVLGGALAVASLGYADALRKFKTRDNDEVESKKARAVPSAVPGHASLAERNITAGVSPRILLSVTEETTELLESHSSLAGDRPDAQTSRTL